MNDLHDMIDMLYKKYNNNEYVLTRMRTFILNQLPNSLSSANELYIERNKRKTELSVCGDKFIEDFLSLHSYYYCNRMEIFIKYDSIHFKQISEDDIHHQVLTTIHTHRNLHVWKHKLKNSLIKILKDRSPLNSIPESITIQNVLNQLYPALFLTKNAAKHFLIAVGDSIKGKKCNTYIVPPSLKWLIREIEGNYYNCFGNLNVLANFKLKYYGHDYNDTRFFQCKMKTSVKIPCNHMLDLLCVSSHYSLRYESADSFVNNAGDNSLYRNVFFSKGLNSKTLITEFKEKALYTLSGAIVKSKDMTFVLKKYFDENNVPNIIFNDAFMCEMKNLVEYNEENDTYHGVTSNYIPAVSAFCLFWDEHMKEDFNSPEMEIDEIISLFFAGHPQFKSLHGVSPEFIIDILKHHVTTELTIENDKFIHNISCNLWDKMLDVESLYIHLKQLDIQPVTLYDAYILYTEWKGNVIKMSKNCFEKISEELMHGFILNGVINEQYWKN